MVSYYFRVVVRENVGDIMHSTEDIACSAADITGCVKKEMCDFLTIIMLPLVLALMKTNIAIFLIHWS